MKNRIKYALAACSIITALSLGTTYLIENGKLEKIIEEYTTEKQLNIYNPATPITEIGWQGRDFGYFIGDLVTQELKIKINNRRSFFLDLSTVPKEGDIHGEFYIRSSKIIDKENELIIRFNMQAFPIFFGQVKNYITFPPFNIDIANIGERDKTGKPVYRTLLTPPTIITYSSIADIRLLANIRPPGYLREHRNIIPHPQQPIEEPINPKSSTLFSIIGSAILGIGVSTYLVRKHKEKVSPPPNIILLGEINQILEYYERNKDPSESYAKIDVALRNYLATIYGEEVRAYLAKDFYEKTNLDPYTSKLVQFLDISSKKLYSGDKIPPTRLLKDIKITLEEHLGGNNAK